MKRTTCLRKCWKKFVLLTNLETPTQKLLQILLVGQPELNQKLDSSNLRQLKQRIALRCNLEPLSEEETRAYVKRRLQLAGSNPEVTIFTRSGDLGDLSPLAWYPATDQYSL